MISVAATAFAVVPTAASASYRAAILCCDPSLQSGRWSALSRIEGKAEVVGARSV
jgi:hypothetical protein